MVVAEVLAAAADAELVVHHLITAQPVEEIAWKQKARGRKRRGGGRGRGGGAETLPQQVINNSAAVQQEK
jgi:hypothetical protein